jgi:hypothetical protein
MVRFQANVTAQGWSVSFESKIEGDEVFEFEVTTAEGLARAFIQAQTSLQAEGQKFVRETLTRETIPPGEAEKTCNLDCWECESKINKAKYDTKEAEALTDSQVSEVTS